MESIQNVIKIHSKCLPRTEKLTVALINSPINVKSIKLHYIHHTGGPDWLINDFLIKDQHEQTDTLVQYYSPPTNHFPNSEALLPSSTVSTHHFITLP